MAPTSSTTGVAAQFAVAVQKKMNDNVTEQGKSAVQLIEAAAPAKASSGSVGTQLDVTA